MHYDSTHVPKPSNDGTARYEPNTTRWGKDSLKFNLFTPVVPINEVTPPKATKEIMVYFNCSSDHYYCSMNDSQFTLPGFPIALSVIENTLLRVHF